MKFALLGADSFEFGTTALMMLKYVMAKNCNVKCPAGLTTNAEAFEGDPRQLAQYFINNVAHEVREILAHLGLHSLREARGRSDLLHLINHQLKMDRLDLRAMLTMVPELKIIHPVCLEKNFKLDDRWFEMLKGRLIKPGATMSLLDYGITLNNRNKSVGGQLMTNGAVINLGTYGIGFGNGMSGGFAYQYDPSGMLVNSVATDSVMLGNITDDNEMVRVHKEAVLTMLYWYLEATSSPLAQWLLDNWETGNRKEIKKRVARRTVYRASWSAGSKTQNGMAHG